ncbi:hypothetical protein [Roseibium alexandrii]|uniref:Superinfection exclusion protein B n=1 Tax=Roseibium alexandrii TaxID=388408 RepID=A0A0M7A023_9HYPH|nr:hypothetical protein [Roseibium alexandrii]CTQ67163.1 hypothetical protein LAX5112_01242 [Roseibium alexandrii]
MYETVISKLGEIIKISPRLGFTLSASCGLIIYLGSTGTVPGIEGFLLTALWLLMALFAAVAASGVLAALQEFSSYIAAWFAKRKHIADLQKQFADDIPRLTDRERMIFGYLLHHNQDTFTAAADAGHATTLVAKGYIYSIGVHGQSVSAARVPFKVRPEVWNLLQDRKEEFPHTARNGRGGDSPPWVVRYA